MAAFQSFLVMMLSDAGLRDELLAPRDLPALMLRVRELAHERGLEISQEDLEKVAATNRRSWIERWVDS